MNLEPMTRARHADTIFALSSGRPPAAIAVIRVSGPRAGVAAERLLGRRIEARRAVLATVRHPQTREPIDQALALWFPAPHSETGEDTLELQVHGGYAVIAAVQEALAAVDGLRPAEAGEFTRRAFANGRIDLTAVEGLADLIGAETEMQRRQALQQLRGALAQRAESWRRQIIEALALVEAALDFADESDVDRDLTPRVRAIADGLRRDIDGVLAQGRRGERLRDGLTVAIAGPPNAGKSSLFNWIAGREAAIVSPYAGTTRDVLEVHLDLGGYPVTVLDTAGVRPSDDPVEQEGVRRAQERAAQADIVLWVEDASAPSGASPEDARTWRVWNKIDLLAESRRNGELGERAFAVSARSGEGLDRLMDALTDAVASQFGSTEPAVVTRARHREALVAASAALTRATVPTIAGDEMMAEELRLAARALGRLLGRIDVEDLLDVIFREFCIGK